MMPKISVAIATYNEEKNIGDCLESVKEIADEIVVVDGRSSDRTVEIVQKYGAKVIQVANDPMFHHMKQQAFDNCRNEWILYLDSDERVSKKLAGEIKNVIKMDDDEVSNYQAKLKNKRLFERHQQLLEDRDSMIGEKDGIYNAFFFPRLNYFLGKYLRHGGVYPDGVIRLFRKGKAYLPCKDVHEQLLVEGKVGWLENDLLHFSDPSFERYLARNSRYIDLLASQMRKDKIRKGIASFINYCVFKPLSWFFLTQIRHKGILDGYQGIIFSFFSALRFPRAYYRYIRSI